MSGKQLLKAIICPSLLSSDFGALGAECRKMIEHGADYLHMDVMDGHFVPNLTFGAPVIKSVRKHTDGFLDCHLMVTRPLQWAKDFKDAGADGFTFHIESEDNTMEVIKKVRELGMRVGIALRPKTPIEEVFPFVDLVDMVLIMTVEPGFGGQSFMPDMMPKVEILRKKYPTLDIQVDGGLSDKTIEQAAKAGANVIVAGSYVFNAPNIAQAIAGLRDAVNRHVIDVQQQ